MKKSIIKITLGIITAVIGFISIAWHIMCVVNNGYSLNEIFNWGTWMNQNLLVILGIFLFLEILIFIPFGNLKIRNEKKNNKKVRWITFAIGFIISLGFMIWWQYNGCPSPEYFFDTGRMNRYSFSWGEYIIETVVWWGPGALISLGILIFFVILGFVLGGKPKPKEKLPSGKISSTEELDDINLF